MQLKWHQHMSHNFFKKQTNQQVSAAPILVVGKDNGRQPVHNINAGRAERTKTKNDSNLQRVVCDMGKCVAKDVLHDHRGTSNHANASGDVASQPRPQHPELRRPCCVVDMHTACTDQRHLFLVFSGRRMVPPFGLPARTRDTHGESGTGHHLRVRVRVRVRVKVRVRVLRF
jgi:hypothetical protein